jgi:MFS transporter, AAHS family, 4-hydroxybenzoate transporter
MAASAQSAIDLSRLLDERAISPLQVLVAVLSGLIMFIDGYDVQVMALAVPLVSHEWSLTPPHFSLALSAVLLGISVGAFFIAPLGDRAGRRTLLILAMAVIGASTMATSTAGSPAQFVLWRLLTGIGLGISIPNCNAWTAEYVPVRSRPTILVVMNAAISAGSFCAGFIAPVIFAHWGWRGAFVIGGVTPLIIGFLIVIVAPESLKFLIVRRPQDRRIASILARIAPELDPATPFHRPEAAARTTRWSLFDLLGPVYRRRTLVLWGVVVANLFSLYVLISWLPTLLQSAGWPLNDALRGAVLIQAGGVFGGILLSVFLSRGTTIPALFVAYLITAACLVLFHTAPAAAAVSWIALLVIGAGTSGSQLALNALSTAYYPPAIKASGMSFAGVVGNVGAFLAPVVGGWGIERGYSSGSILGMLAAPLVLCALGVLFMRREWQWN